MSISANQSLGSDRDSIPPKRQDEELDWPKRSPEATFKVPLPYRSHGALKNSHTGPPLQPVPVRVPPLYQPWIQSPAKVKPHTPSTVPQHRGWTDWRAFYPQGWDTLYPVCLPAQHQSPLSGYSRGVGLSGYHFDAPHRPSKFRSATLIAEDTHAPVAGQRWETPVLREHASLYTERPRHSRGPYMKRRDRQASQSRAGVTPCPTSLTAPPPATASKDRVAHVEFVAKRQMAIDSPGPLLQASLRPTPVECSAQKFPTTGAEDNSLSSAHSSTVAISSSSSSSSPKDTMPWLLPHFAAGSLIELRDGRLRRVEDLQVEDFLLGSLACPELRLSCCTVQRISPSSASSSLSRLLILLHDQRSQELVDVYSEYPFFVREQGWSSCCPEKTSCLCGLRCRQLCVGDICLILTPVPPHAPSAAQATSQGLDTSNREAEGRCGTLKPTCSVSAFSTQLSPAGRGREMVSKSGRRRRWSAPELRVSGTDCPC